MRAARAPGTVEQVEEMANRRRLLQTRSFGDALAQRGDLALHARAGRAEPAHALAEFFARR